jgi:hypothetical protein
MADEERAPYFPEPTTPDLTWARYSDSGRQVEWLDRSTLPQAQRIREFLNRSLAALPADAGQTLAHRFRHDPPFGRVFFELVVGRFLQVLGGEVAYQPIGLGSVNVDWRATFAGGETVYVEATSPAYNQGASRERRRREAMLGVIEREVPAGWWVIPRTLPALGLDDPRREFRRVVQSMFRSLPGPAGVTFDNRIRLEGTTSHGALVLEVWPGAPTKGPIAMVSMGAWRDDSALKVAVAAGIKKLRQARAFPGEVVLLAIDAPFGGPDVEDFDQALLGHSVLHLDLDGRPTHTSFRAEGALAKQQVAEYAGVLAFGRVGTFGGLDPTLYRHPRFVGSLPPEILDLRQRFLDGAAIGDVPAKRAEIIDGIGFPVPDD